MGGVGWGVEGGAGVGGGGAGGGWDRTGLGWDRTGLGGGALRVGWDWRKGCPRGEMERRQDLVEV